ncbi:uncharacterized protein troap isoform X2 [Betta splendens]|uniref:Uncharacterized protein troap isoform X2 n=1 Tax=Betta splendens TaxID=158456 RepID=A0A9W2XXE5_BETSP|nr:uncharacterized protein troap isoform X2 [Betta splendens]
MDSSSVLRNQSNNKFQSDLSRMKNEHNKMTTEPKAFRLQPAPDLPNQDSENQDPGNSKMVIKAPQRPGVSRLPVLAKSLHLQTPSNFSQSHCRWEDKPLAGKTKKKRPCTRPAPFNLSEPRSSKVTHENQQPSNVSHLRTSTRAVELEKNVCNASPRKQSLNTNLSKHPPVVSSTAASTKGAVKSNGNNTDNMIHPKPLTTLSSSLLSAHLSVSVENSTNIQPVRVKCSTKSSHGSQNSQLTTPYSKGSTDKRENFQLDHAALLSILCNEGVSATGTASATPQSKPFNCLPQRVSVMKSQQKARHVPASVKSVQFTPDAAALRSILLNEGVKAAGPVDASSRTSVCPSGRGTSVYTAQRVPVKKKRAELMTGSVGAVKGTPLPQCTPQRVPNTRHQPMSAMKYHLSTQPSSCVRLGLKSCRPELQLKQEEVVQRLFDDQEDEQTPNVTEKDPKTQAEQLPAHHSATTGHCEDNVETSRANTSKDEADEEEQERPAVGGQPFLQAQGRESVIFFSTGKKLVRVPRMESQERSSHQDQCGPDSSEQRTSKLPEEILSVGVPTCPLKPAVHSLHRDLILQNSPVALLRKRLPPLEELRMDEEVATYTSSSAPAAPGFVPPRPRCGNPLAAVLHFEESTKFVPVSFDLFSSP